MCKTTFRRTKWWWQIFKMVFGPPDQIIDHTFTWRQIIETFYSANNIFAKRYVRVEPSDDVITFMFLWLRWRETENININTWWMVPTSDYLGFIQHKYSHAAYICRSRSSLLDASVRVSYKADALYIGESVSCTPPSLYRFLASSVHPLLTTPFPINFLALVWLQGPSK